MPTRLDLDQARQDYEDSFYRFYIAMKEYEKYPNDKSIHKEYERASSESDRMLYLYCKAIIESRKRSAEE